MTEWNLAGLALISLIWLIGGIVLWHAQRRLPRSHEMEEKRFRMSRTWRLAGLALALIGPALIGAMLALVPVQAPDALAALLLAAFLGGLSPLIGLGLLLHAVRTDALHLHAFDFWGRPASVRWQDIRSISLHFTAALRFESGGKTVYAPLEIENWPVFLAEIEQRLAHLPMPDALRQGQALRADGARLAFEAHWQRMYDGAGRSTLISAVLAAVATYWAGLCAAALWIAALAGALFAVYPVIRRLIPTPRRFAATLGNLLQGGGIVGGIVLLQMAATRHAACQGVDKLDDGLWLAMTVQHIAMTFAAASLLLLLARWVWPRRFSRARLGWADGVRP